MLSNNRHELNFASAVVTGMMFLSFKNYHNIFNSTKPNLTKIKPNSTQFNLTFSSKLGPIVFRLFILLMREQATPRQVAKREKVHRKIKAAQQKFCNKYTAATALNFDREKLTTSRKLPILFSLC